MNSDIVYIIIKTKKQTSKLNPNEILYVENDLRRIVIYTTNEIHTVYGSIDGFYQLLGEDFYKCHSRCILNFGMVISMQEGVFYLEGGRTLRIGQNYYQCAKKKYNEFLASRL